ncbi:3-phosphoserine/phosphohydroxythreonine transaminase [Nitrosomonas sp.]|uniref:3-phosphoserine/phosphohydroxythreonine transaminase n=1 Tax=Nitrosomonas sp. TaxID=42353 RepID=UPI001DB4CDB0|nr:3-phosphoserine/phosphohydroxythreonine transaminase [Nitrosomonas sp.]MCB1949056.1 3-phosphoserine/phosphohydroxythreonine transaminase [Nitrosomonas sp.]MCP5242121.1 3-phosphoserine/phosphohydroxythreonine transaminase [Burkholderiales bacterium]MDR4514682.1 3-phosphoserine/phosphohydroxythreonine transaminase [Nitrosomonas sp.]
MNQIYNFSAGPATLPKEVLQQARDEMLDWHGCGMSVMEMSHRGREFTSIIESLEQDLRELANIPSNYKILFLQGGASSQFAMVPMNLLRGKTKADYIHTGQWADKAINEAKRFCFVNIAASSEDARFTCIPPQDQWSIDRDSAYIHLTSNETIGGVEFHWTPELPLDHDMPIVADMSSNILSRPLDVTRYGLIYAGAQKNLGPAGLVLVIIREDLAGFAQPGTPTLFDYQVHIAHDSMYNTPPTYAVYITGLVLKWLRRQGGLEAIEQINIRKSALLYDFIDSCDFYHCPVAKADRSRMNIPFTLKDSALDTAFLEQAEANGLVQLKGHRSVGGMRASLYNAMPMEGVVQLVEFMKEFANKNA